jgi:signal transducing adaptor molecule
LGLVATWTADFEEDSSLGIMEDCYNNLKAKSEYHSLQSAKNIVQMNPDVDYKFEQPEEIAPPAVDDEIRRKEEEELQRVLEMSMQDRGGRPQWSQYSLAPATSSSTTSKPASGPSASPAATASSSTAPAPHPFAQPKYPGGGYAPARTPSPMAATPQQQQQQRYQPPQTQPQPQSQTPNLASSTLSNSAASSSATPAASTTAATATPAAATTATSPSTMAENGNIVTRVRALHTFEPTEAGELAFEKGDIIKVVDRGYKDWWRGQLKGRTGIFPVNYVVRSCF